MRLALTLFLALAAVIPGLSDGAHAAPMPQSRVQGLLQSARFTELDAYLAQRQREYGMGSITEEDLRDDFRAFYPVDPQLSRKYDSWIQLLPQSYVARLARAIYYIKVAEEQRGGAYADRTSDAQFENMRIALRQAAEDLEVSLTLEPKPILSLVRAIDIAAYLGVGDRGRQFLDRAIALDPDTFLARATFMRNLQTRWGGSLDQMQAFFAECSRARLSKTHLDLLESTLAEEQGWLHVHESGDAAAAMLDFQRAKSLNPGLCLACEKAELSDLLMSQAKYAQAISLLSDILEHQPSDAHALCNRGEAYLNMGRAREAVADWTHGAGSGDPCSQNRLGALYMNGLPGVLDKNTDVAIEWYGKAALQGDAAGIDNLKRAREFVARTQPTDHPAR